MLSLRSLRDALAGRSRQSSEEAQESTTQLQLPYLPPELLLHIIQLAVSPAFPDDSLPDRLSSLRSFSLVSRIWREAAQFELFQSAVLYDARTMREFLGALALRADLARLVKVLFIGRARRKAPLEWGAEMRALFKQCPNLNQLNLGSVKGVRLDEILRCSNLRALSAINTSFETPPFPSPSLAPVESSSPSCASSPTSHPTLSQLQYLDLGRCALPLGSVPAQAFPSLRAIALWLTSEEVEASTEPITQLFHQIEAQLLALTISGSLHDVLSPSLRRMSSLKLVDVWDFSSLDVLDALEHPLQLLHINMAGRRSSTHPDRTPLAITSNNVSAIPAPKLPSAAYKRFGSRSRNLQQLHQASSSWRKSAR